MEKIAQFLDHARDCLELAGRLPSEQSEAVVRIAEDWIDLASERRRLLMRVGSEAGLARTESALPRH
jgi:hypothetical protein